MRVTDKLGLKPGMNHIVIELIYKKSNIILDTASDSNPMIEKTIIRDIGANVFGDHKIGDNVIINPMSIRNAMGFGYFGRDYLVIRESDIIGTLHDMEEDKSFKDVSDTKVFIPKTVSRNPKESSYLEQIDVN